jgi:hypothetical protein
MLSLQFSATVQAEAPTKPKVGRFVLPPIVNRFIPRRSDEDKTTPPTKSGERGPAKPQVADKKKTPQPEPAKPNITSQPKAATEIANSTAAITKSIREITSPKLENVIELENPPQTPSINPPVPTRDPGIFSVLVADKPPATSNWKSLFNGKDLTQWESSKFGGDGEITVDEGAIVLGVGGDMTGVTYRGEVPKMNYALEVEAQRREGSDFFAGITFPVADAHVTLIPGGWGGGVFGISCINLNDASENETTKPKTFDDKRWYTFRIQVTEGRVQVWVDGKEEIDLLTADKKLSTRGEVESSKPLGISTWRTEGAIRAIKIRSLTPQEILAAAPKK